MRFKKDICIFLGIYLIIYIYTVTNPVLPDYDWFNYKLYNVWAFIHNRMPIDFLAANSRTCYNPLLDIPSYISLFSMNKNPFIFIFAGLWDSTAALFLIYKIINLIFLNRSKQYMVFCITFCILYVIFSPVMILQLSFDQNDIKIAVLCLLSIYLLLKNLFSSDSRKRNIIIFLAGCILGTAIGLKLTAIVYCVTLSLVILILCKFIDKPFKAFLCFLSGILIFFSVFEGFWLYKCWKYYHNPIFPYLNNIFLSEFTDSINFIDRDYSHIKAANIKEFLLFPFIHSVKFQKLIGTDNYSWDSRYAINLICILFLIPLSVFHYKHRKNELFLNLIKYNHLFFILSLVFISFYINSFIFGTYRYIISTSLLYGIIFMIFIHFITTQKILTKNKYKICIIIGCLLTVFIYLNQNVGDVEFVKNNTIDRKYKLTQVIQLKNMHFDDNSYVIAINGGNSYNFIRQNPKVTYLGSVVPKDFLLEQQKIFEKYSMIFSLHMISEYGENKISEILASNAKVYIIYSDIVYEKLLLYYTISAFENLEKQKTRKIENCEIVETPIYNTIYWPTTHIKCEYNKIKKN